MVRRDVTSIGRTTQRLAVFIVATVLGLPLLFGIMIALAGALSKDFRAGAEDGPDEESATLATGALRSSDDLTRLVRAALEEQGHAAGAIDCPTLTRSPTERSYTCTGSVAGWKRVSVNVHRDRRFTVVGSNIGP